MPEYHNGVLIISEYNNGKLSDIVMYDVNTSGDFHIPQNMTESVKAILVENMDNIKPLCSSVSIK